MKFFRIFFIAISLLACRPQMSFAQGDKIENEIRDFLTLILTEQDFTTAFARSYHRLRYEHPNIPPSFWSAFEPEANSDFQEFYMDKLVEIYREMFTPKEVKSMLRFFSSAEGQHFLEVQNQLAQRSAEIGPAWNMAMTGMISDRLRGLGYISGANDPQDSMFIPSDLGLRFPDWIWFDSPTGDFRIHMPAYPDINRQEIPTDLGNIPMFSYMLERKVDEDDNLLYAVLYSEYPRELLALMTDKEQLYREAIDGGVANVKGELLSERVIVYDRYEGREARISYASGAAILRIRYFLVNNRMYMLQTIYPAVREKNLARIHFFRSFQFTGN